MKDERLIKILFGIAALYDAVLGLAFLFAPLTIFAAFGETPPNHPGYVQFPAALLLVFAAMFFSLTVNPRANRNLIPYGILLKVSYCALVFGYWSFQGLPAMWKPYAFADIIFAALFVWAWWRLAPSKGQA